MGHRCTESCAPVEYVAKFGTTITVRSSFGRNSEALVAGLHILTHFRRPAQIIKGHIGLPDMAEIPRISDSSTAKETTLLQAGRLTAVWATLIPSWWIRQAYIAI